MIAAAGAITRTRVIKYPPASSALPLNPPAIPPVIDPKPCPACHLPCWYVQLYAAPLTTNQIFTIVISTWNWILWTQIFSVQIWHDVEDVGCKCSHYGEKCSVSPQAKPIAHCTLHSSQCTLHNAQRSADCTMHNVEPPSGNRQMMPLLSLLYPDPSPATDPSHEKSR